MNFSRKRADTSIKERRFATFKLFYRDNTPTDYEPPYFRPGDPVKDKYIFTTHDQSEKPEKFSVGSLATPHHGSVSQSKIIISLDDALKGRHAYTICDQVYSKRREE